MILNNWSKVQQTQDLYEQVTTLKDITPVKLSLSYDWFEVKLK